MNYKSYSQVVGDINYIGMVNKQGAFLRHPTHDGIIGGSPLGFDKLNIMWQEHMKERYEATKNTNNALGKFLKKFPLSFKEFFCLINLIEDNIEKSDFEFDRGIGEKIDIFKKYGIRYESSQLKKFKLVYKIVNPLRPLKIYYEISYKAQLAIKNKKYTDEYQQLDLALEEESKRNSPDQLDSLYYVVNPIFNFNNLIATERLKENLKSALARELKKDKIFKNWGFDNVIKYGKGTTLNFRGPPGTGKTLAAHCFAKELGKKLLIVRYDQLQSCWIGETEKHIQMVFKIARLKDAVLFFDEADAVALSRDNFSKSWEMSQINTLLKELERYNGACIFATNFAEKYDQAFERRLTMHIDFKLPDKEQAIEILDKVLPKKSRAKELSLKNIDLTNLSGGDIKNIALNAAGIAVKEDFKKITKKHIEEAIALVRNAKNIAENKEVNYIS